MSKYLLLLGLFIGILSLKAEELRFEHYSGEKGLSHNSIRSVLQDDKGFLWFGTLGGINRFDGNEFKPFTSSTNDGNSLLDDDITRLVLDGDDNMWIGTSLGLTRYNLATGVFTTFLSDASVPNSICGNEIRSLYIDNSKRLWIGTKHNGLCYFDQKTEQFHKFNPIGAVYVKSIRQTSDNKFFVGTYESGIYSFDFTPDGNVSDFQRLQLKNEEGKLINSTVFFLYEDHKFDLFAGTRTGLYKLNKLLGEFELMHQKEGLNDFFRCIVRGPDREYWVGTSNGIIKCQRLEDIVTDEYDRYNTDLFYAKTLVNNYITCLFFDKSGVLWIGTENGIEKYDPFDNQISMSRIEGGQSNNKPIVSSLAQTYNGHTIIGTHNDGLYIRKSTGIESIPSQELRIVSIYTNDGKVFYCGLWNGQIAKYDYITSHIEILDLSIPEFPISTMLLLDDKRLLVGTDGYGIVEYDLKSHQHHRISPEKIGNFIIVKMIKNYSGLVWIATDDGIFKYDQRLETLKSYKSSKSFPSCLSNNHIKDVLIDNKGIVWAATRHGLNYYDPLNDCFNVVDGPIELRNIWVTDLAIDSLDQLWLNMNFNQIGRYNTKENRLNVLTLNNGVRSNTYNKRGFLFADNTFYVGGENSLTYFNTAEFRDFNYSPAPVITAFKVRNKTVLPGDTIHSQRILDQDLNYIHEVELDYDNRFFSITFSSLSFVKEEENTYQYMLEGFDETWIDASRNSRTVQYTNLRPDNYLFKVRAMNCDGYWSDVSSYKVNINYPFWLTYGAFLFYIIVFLISVYFIRKGIVNRYNSKQVLLLDKVKRDRDEKLTNEKLRFFTNISHELRTPITLILGPSKQLLESEDLSDYQKSRVGLILNNSNRLLYIVNQLLDFRKVRHGGLKLKVSNTDILPYVRTTFNLFEDFAKDKKIHFNFASEEEEVLGWVDRDKLDMILYNLLSNAVKFTPKHGNVDLFLSVQKSESRQLIIEVSDDGVGIPPESIDAIFSRFYQVESHRKDNTGSGIGLSLVKELISLHKGEVSVKSSPNSGTLFTIEIPLDKSSYAENEIFDYEGTPDVDDAVPQINAKKVAQSVSIKEKILVVEDNDEVRKFIVDYLSDFYKVYEADNGQKGLEVCKQVKPILCVADVMMPIMDGFQFCTELKKDDNISHIPVVLLTALSDNDSKIKGYKLGADGYLMKPFDPILLKTRIENIVKARVELKHRFSEDEETDSSLITHSPIDEQFMKKLLDFIDAKIDFPELTANLLCVEMGMSSSKLYRKIKELTDRSPNELIRIIRLKKAMVLLKEKRFNVSEVAVQVGFNDPLYFSRCFKKQFGYPPSKIIK